MAWRSRLFSAALLVAACGGSDVVDAPVRPPHGDAPAIMLSAPVPRSTIAEDTASGTVVFVSAAPGAFARGERVLLGRSGAAASSTAPVVGGGFDAVPLRAAVGDEILVTVVDSGGARTTETVLARAPQRPRVVRTSPGPVRSDVPLNLVAQVVFSAPMDAASVSSALELYRGGTRVQGTVTLANADGTTASFVPAAPLEASTGYRLVLAASARDVLGQALDSSVVVPFTTGTSASTPSLALVAIDRALLRLELGAVVDVDAWVCVRYSVPCMQVTADVSWSSTSPGVAAVQALGAEAGQGRARIAAVSSGTASIVAAAAGHADTMEVHVASPSPEASLAANELVFSSGSVDFVTMNLYAIRADGTGLTQLTHVVSRSFSQPSVARDGRIVFLEDFATLSVRELDGTVHPLSSVASFGLDVPNCPAWSPDMRYVAYQNSADPSFPDRQGILVVRADGSGDVVAAINAPATCPSWSPDGTQLSYGLSDREGLRLAVADATRFPEVVVRVGPLRQGHAKFGRWSPDGNGVATSERTRTDRWIERTPVDGTGGAWIAWLPPDADVYGPTMPDWSSDGRLIAYGDGAGGMIVVDALIGGNGWWERRLPFGGFDPAFVPAGVGFTR